MAMSDSNNNDRTLTIVLYYKYVPIEDPERYRDDHTSLCESLNLTGRVLIAAEGINSSLAGTHKAIEDYIETLREDARFRDVDFKTSQTENSRPFPDLFVKCVPEIISTGKRIGRESLKNRGQHLSPEDFHQKLEEAMSKGVPKQEEEGHFEPKDTVLLDCRNKKENAIGRFDGATRIPMKSFANYPEYVDKHIDTFKGKQILMYCTGGVRCEKASAYLKSKGIEEVYQLNGGIHRYLEKFPDGGYWKGKNFVFDNRGSMDIEDQNSAVVVGQCYNCHAPFDTYDGATVCTVCREPVLACTRCREELDHVFYCEDHTQLKGIYFHYVDAFTSEDLAKQADQLRNLEKLPQSRHQRRTLRKQITRLENRQKEIKEGKIDPTDNLRTPPCRTCFARSCKGNCWGFHGKH